MQHFVELTLQGRTGQLPCGDCLHDVGGSCGMAGAAPCPLLEAAKRGAPSAFKDRDGRLVCSAFEPAFPDDLH